MSRGRRRPIRGDLVGRDFARVRPASSRLGARVWGWLIVAAAAGALGVTALRIDILRLRYALGEAVHAETTLLQQRGQHSARVETLRDPNRLVEVARQRGFGRPERILELRTDLASAEPRSDVANAGRP